MQPQIIQVKVKPNSPVSHFEQGEDGTWLARLKSLPIDGKANEELVALIAKRFKCRKAAVSIKSGASGRMKLVRIEAPVMLCSSNTPPDPSIEGVTQRLRLSVTPHVKRQLPYRHSPCRTTLH